VYVFMFVCVYVNMYVCMYVCMFVCMYVCVMYVCTYVCTCTYALIHNTVCAHRSGEESRAAAAENNAAAVLKEIQAASAQAAAAAESNEIMTQVLKKRKEAAAKMTQRMQSATRDRVPSGQSPEAKHHEATHDATHDAMHDGHHPSRAVETPPLRHKHLLKPDAEGGLPGSKDKERDVQYRRHASALSNAGRAVVFPRRAPPAVVWIINIDTHSLLLSYTHNAHVHIHA